MHFLPSFFLLSTLLDAKSFGACKDAKVKQFRGQNKYMRYFLGEETYSPIFSGKSVFGERSISDTPYT